MNESKHDSLEAALAGLPREVQPDRDLWPDIRAEIAKTPIAAQAPGYGGLARARWFQLAAGVLLVIASSVTTYLLTRESMQDPAARVARDAAPAPALRAVPAGFSFGQDTLGAGYVDARAELDKVFQQRLAQLPPAARAKVERNLADLRQAASEISATLAEHPSDPLLQELLISTYQSELKLLGDVSELPSAGSMRADL